MIKIYGSGGNRWVRPCWTAREADVPFEAVTISIRKGENRSAAFLDINPFGKLPAMEDGPVKLFESAAICTYIAGLRPEKQLVPAMGTLERAYFDQWASFAISELEQPLWRMTRHTFVYPEAKRSQAEIELAQEDFSKTASVFERVITDYLVGDRFTVADILVTYALQWAKLGGNLGADFPRLNQYLSKHLARPAFPRELFA